MPDIDKILVSNNTALRAKYGAAVASVHAAVAALIAADAGRGLNAIYLAVDSAAHMSGIGPAVTVPADQPQNKAAIDAICTAHDPHYLVIVGAIDVIPHQDLDNPVFNPRSPDDDPDRTVPSDLPYACAAPHSRRPQNFVGPTRVVTRLPDVTGAINPAYFTHVIDLAASAVTLAHADYRNYLGVSATVWTGSTAASLAATFGSSTAMQAVPPAGSAWPAALLGLRSHFFNCHGAQATPQYFGQSGKKYPVAHDAVYIAGKLTPGTVASVECCYGAELYDPGGVVGGQMGIANVYLDDGAYGFWGSTTIAYGPATSNANADLIAQYFLQEILQGATIGRAALSARQRFARSTHVLSPTDLKTLAQFIVLGDASIQPVPAPDAAVAVAQKFAFAGVSEAATCRQSRSERRRQLAIDGVTLAATTPVAAQVAESPGGDLGSTLRDIAKRCGMQEPAMLSFVVEEPPAPHVMLPYRFIAETEKHPTGFHLLVERMPEPITSSGPRPVHVVEVTEENGKLVRVRDLFSR